MTDPSGDYRAYLMSLLASETDTERAYADVFLAASARARSSVINNTNSWAEVDTQYPWFASTMELIVDTAVRDTIAVLGEKGLLRG